MSWKATSSAATSSRRAGRADSGAIGGHGGGAAVHVPVQLGVVGGPVHRTQSTASSPCRPAVRRAAVVARARRRAARAIPDDHCSPRPSRRRSALPVVQRCPARAGSGRSWRPRASTISSARRAVAVQRRERRPDLGRGRRSRPPELRVVAPLHPRHRSSTPSGRMQSCSFAHPVPAYGLTDPARMTSLYSHNMIFITGKGGVGKTTVALGVGAGGRRAGPSHHRLRGRRAPAGRGYPGDACGPTTARRRRSPRGCGRRRSARGGRWRSGRAASSAARSLYRRSSPGSNAFQYFVAAAPGTDELVTMTEDLGGSPRTSAGDSQSRGYPTRGRR